MLLRTLGGMRLEGAAFSRPKPLLLLAYLAVEGPKDRRYLSRLFWPRAPSPYTNLRTALSQLRHGAPGAVRSDETRLSTDVPVDAKEVLDGLPLERETELDDLYPGPFLEGLYLPDMGEELEEWVFATRELVADTVRSHLLDSAEMLLGRGESKAAARQAELAWRLPGAPESTPEVLERAYRLLRAGGSVQAERLRAEALEYGIELGTGAADDHRPVDGACERAPNNLGHRTTSFEGRDPELLELSKLLSDPGTRLVTLVGPGGSGKTSLALVAAHQELKAGTFPGGVHFVELEEVANGEALLSELAGVLQAEDDVHTVDSIAALIGQQRLLIVLDNCEHLTGEMRPLSELLTSCGNLTVLATSRERLNVQGEQLFPVDGLPFPEAPEVESETRYLDSVRLFEKRAKRVDLSFTLDESNLPHVASICRSVAGSPLAIELAAALTGVLTPEELAEELVRHPGLLSAPNLDVPDRHKSLRATFDHSWRLLADGERNALAALAVFAGGFSRVAAARVAGLTIPMLASLIDKSLVRRLDHGRYGCHPLVRDFALEKLEAVPARAEQVRRARDAYLIELGTGTAAKASDVERVYAEIENYRAALTHAVREERWSTGLELVAAVWPAWHAKGDWREARRWLDAVISGYEDAGTGPEQSASADLDPGIASALAEAHRGIGVLARAQGDLEVARRSTIASLEISRRLGDDERVGSLTNQLGVIALHLGEFEAAEAQFTEALAVRRRIGDRTGIAATLNNLGAMAGRRGDLEAAERFYSEGLSLYRELGNQAAVAIVLSNLGDVAEARGDMVLARELYEESMALHQTNGDHIGIAACSARLAAVSRRNGELSTARKLCLGALRTFHELDDVDGTAECLNELGMIFAADGRPETAAAAWGAMSSLLEAAGTPLPVIQARDHERSVALTRGAIDAEAFERAWARGRSMSREEMLGLAEGGARAEVSQRRS